MWRKRLAVGLAGKTWGLSIAEVATVFPWYMGGRAHLVALASDMGMRPGSMMHVGATYTAARCQP